MATPCIEDSFSITLGMDAGRLQAALIRDPDPDNHLEILASGVRVPLGRGSNMTKVSDESTYSVNDDSLHQGLYTSISVGPNDSAWTWHVLAVACFDPVFLGLGGSSDTDFAPFTLGAQLEIDAAPVTLYDQRVGEWFSSRAGVNPTTAVAQAPLTIAFTVDPTQTRQVNFYRWIQRLSGASNPDGFIWTPATATCTILRVG